MAYNSVEFSLMANTTVGGEKDRTNEVRRLSTLLEISQALSGVLNLRAALQSVLEILEKRHQVVGGAVFLQDQDTRELHVEASSGDRLPGARGRGRPGERDESITGAGAGHGQTGRRATRQPGADPGRGERAIAPSPVAS